MAGYDAWHPAVSQPDTPRPTMISPKPRRNLLSGVIVVTPILYPGVIRTIRVPRTPFVSSVRIRTTDRIAKTRGPESTIDHAATTSRLARTRRSTGYRGSTGFRRICRGGPADAARRNCANRRWFGWPRREGRARCPVDTVRSSSPGRLRRNPSLLPRFRHNVHSGRLTDDPVGRRNIRMQSINLIFYAFDGISDPALLPPLPVEQHGTTVT